MRNRSLGVTSFLLLFVLVAPTASAAPWPMTVKAGPAPKCVTYNILDEGAFTTTFEIINNCLVPYNLRMDTRGGPDSDCYDVPPKDRRRGDVLTPLDGFRGVVIC